MRVNWMRRIDVWCGVPICFILTMWRRLAGDFERAEVSVPAGDLPKRILFVQTAEMGSLVLALPAVRYVQSRYPGSTAYALVFTQLRDCVSAIGFVPDARVFTIDPSSLFTIARDSLRFIRHARKVGIDTVVNFEMFARFGAMLSYLSGARRRAGLHAFGQPGLYCGDLLTHRVIYNPHIHTAEMFLTIARALDEPTSDVPMGKMPRAGSLKPSLTGVRIETDARRMRQHLEGLQPAIAGKRLIVVNPNASQLIPIRRWPIDYYAELVRRLLDDGSNAVVLTGTASEHADTRYITQRVTGDALIDLAGKTTIRDLLDLYAAAEVLVTNDSGPAQLAALTGIEICVFFGPETPRLYQPLVAEARCTVLYSEYACSPCVSAFNQRRTECNDNQCLKVIDVETAVRAVTAALERRLIAAPAGS